jgi:hypothetical protein
LDLVPYGHLLVDLEIQGFELIDDPLAVRIQYQSVEDLAADHKYADLSCQGRIPIGNVLFKHKVLTPLKILENKILTTGFPCRKNSIVQEQEKPVGKA